MEYIKVITIVNQAFLMGSILEAAKWSVMILIPKGLGPSEVGVEDCSLRCQL